MFIGEVLSSGAIPALEMTLRFAGERQKLINHNIANLQTPFFRPMDVSTSGFQETLREAIQKRRESGGGMVGPLEGRLLIRVHRQLEPRAFFDALESFAREASQIGAGGEEIDE